MSEDYMSLALDLARQAQGNTRPNPPVGAILVKNGRIVGQGFTQPAGEAHAEIVALNQAGEEARGADLYASLEPCSHWGRTPPCAEALVQAGVARAHIALLDPNPQVKGGGVKRLEQSGVEVALGDHAVEAAELIEAHAIYTGQGRPFVTLVDPDVPEDVKDQLMSQSDLVVADETRELSTEELLEQLRAKQVTSWLVLDNQRLRNRLLAEHLVDRIATPIGAKIPEGFEVRKRLEVPSPHLLLYHDASEELHRGPQNPARPRNTHL